MAKVTVQQDKDVELTSDFCYGKAAEVLLGNEFVDQMGRPVNTERADAWRKLGDSLVFKDGNA